MAVVIFFGARWMPDGDVSWTRALVALLALVATGAAVYGAGAVVLRMPELRWLMRRGS